MSTGGDPTRLNARFLLSKKSRLRRLTIDFGDILPLVYLIVQGPFLLISRNCIHVLGHAMGLGGGGVEGLHD